MGGSLRQVAVVAFIAGVGAAPGFVLQRRRTKGTWSLVKGTIENDEGLDETVRRECLEEAGVEVGSVLVIIGAYEYRKRFAMEPHQLFDVTVVLAQVNSIRDHYREIRERERMIVAREEAVLAIGSEAERWLLWRAFDNVKISKSFEWISDSGGATGQEYYGFSI